MAAKARELASKLAPEAEAEHFRRGLVIIYGGQPKEITGAGHGSLDSDQHLLDIDEDALRLASHEADLLPVHPAHPKNLLRALR